MSRPLGIAMRRAITIPTSSLPTRNPSRNVFKTRRILLSCSVRFGARDLPKAVITNVTDSEIEITSPWPRDNDGLLAVLAGALEVEKSKLQVVSGWRDINRIISMPLMALGRETIRGAAENATDENPQAAEDRLVQLVKGRLQSAQTRWKGILRVPRHQMLKAAGKSIGIATAATKNDGSWDSKQSKKKTPKQDTAEDDLNPIPGRDNYFFY